jgi:DNA-binding CsgD family transcriptional regulator
MPRIDADDATLASYALDILRPHLERAFAIRGQLQFERLRGEAGLVGLDALEIGVALLDPEARVLFLNAPAETILRARDGLSLRGQTLQASGTAHDRFAAAVRRCCVLGGDLIAVPRPSGRRPYVLSIVPSGSGRDRLPVRAATVFITDPEKQPRSNIDAVRAAYGLTEAEAKLCTRLHEGLTLKQVAERSGISLNTAKTHLASVFGKTSTGRQSELIKLLTAPFISRA